MSHADSQGYPPIGDYALIGDCRTAALVSSQGSIDWLCLPHFSGGAVFAALLDQRRGGHFAVRPFGPAHRSRRYQGQSNVLETTFTTAEGRVRVIDCLPLLDDAAYSEGIQPQREVLRVIEGVAGEVEMAVEFAPRPDYARRSPPIAARGALGWTCQAGSQVLILHTDVALQRSADGLTVSGCIRLCAGERRYLSLTYAQRDIGVVAPLGADADARLAATRRWWQRWAAAFSYEGPYREHVLRSALTLKALTYGLSGALVAAPTSSLPERPGGVRNWDYRYCWLRDAALTLRAFTDVGFVQEGQGFLEWLLHATALTWPDLQVLYDVYGETDLTEETLGHLEGYAGSRPVRIGNAADRQLQLDVYGEVLLAAHSFVRQGGSLSHHDARLLRGFGRTVCRRWREADQGIWEVRTSPRQHTHSKLMCWVALDRLLKLHESGALGRVRVPVERLRREWAAIHDAIESRALDRHDGGYVDVFEGSEVDASLLFMARYGYVDASDPRMQATYARIERELTRDGLVYRYRPGYDDALPPGEGAFLITSFWAVDYLVRAGRQAEAAERFEGLLGYANDLGLLAEQADPATGALLGNFPQAFSHVGLISAALCLGRGPQPSG